MSLAMVVLYDMRNFEFEDTTMKIGMGRSFNGTLFLISKSGFMGMYYDSCY